MSLALPQVAVTAARPPELAELDPSAHSLVTYAITVAMLAMFAGFVHAWNSKSEISARYRPSTYAHLLITGVAFLSYAVIIVQFNRAYELTGGQYVPNDLAFDAMVTRYMDWSVTVPLLVVELLAVSTLAGRKRAGARIAAMALAFAMIFTGYLGTQVFAQGGDLFWLWLWWGVSTACFVGMYVVLLPAVVASVRRLSRDAGRSYALAAALLGAVFLVYPLVYLVPVVAFGGWWTASMHVAFSAADVVAKVGFGVLIHKVAKLRTAEDVLAGEEAHPEPVWVDDELRSPAVLPAQRPASDLERLEAHARAEAVTQGTSGARRR